MGEELATELRIANEKIRKNSVAITPCRNHYMLNGGLGLAQVGGTGSSEATFGDLSLSQISHCPASTMRCEDPTTRPEIPSLPFMPEDDTASWPEGHCTPDHDFSGSQIASRDPSPLTSQCDWDHAV